jgi:hypothetical protein
MLSHRENVRIPKFWQKSKLFQILTEVMKGFDLGQTNHNYLMFVYL